MLETGMRPEEVHRIRPENVHIPQGYLFNPYGKTKAAKRCVPLTLAAKTVLRQRMKSEGTYLFLCETDDARPIPKVNNAHDRAVRDSKLASLSPLRSQAHMGASSVDGGYRSGNAGAHGYRWFSVTLTPPRSISTKLWSASKSSLQWSEPRLKRKNLRQICPRGTFRSEAEITMCSGTLDQTAGTRYIICYTPPAGCSLS
jgi:hypothetical protein